MSIFDKYDLHDVDEAFDIPDKPTQGLTLVVGTSGSGKSTILRSWGMGDVEYNLTTPIHELFKSEEECESLLMSCGLRSVPCWKRSLSQLSNGERHRAEIALGMSNGETIFDEFSSVVDRNTARSLSIAMRKHFDRHCMDSMVIATCHMDVEEWLTPDNIYNTDKQEWVIKKASGFDLLFHLESNPPQSKIGFVSKSITI
jgi:energy-coupling factor transporter ATP-binding protein EcfA2